MAKPTQRHAYRRLVGNATVPAEAWDCSHPDHDWWVNGRGWCYDPECPQHDYGPRADPGPGLTDHAQHEIAQLTRFAEDTQRRNGRTMIHIALVTAHPTETDARHALPGLPDNATYLGTWLLPVHENLSDRPEAHAFTDNPDEADAGDLSRAGWERA